MRPSDRRLLSSPAGLLLILCALGGGVRTVSAAVDETSDWQVRVWRKPTPGVDMGVYGLTQTADDFLWFATKHRLARFDGMEFENFPAVDFFSNNTSLHCLLNTRDQAVWLGGSDGWLARLKSGQIERFHNDAVKGLPRCLVEDADGAVWISYDTGSVFRFKEGKFTRQDAGLPGRYAPLLITDRSGRVWFAGSSKIGRFQNGRFETLLTLGSYVRIHISPCSTGGIWICKDNELLKYSGDGAPRSCGTFLTTAPTHSTALLEDDDGSVWIGTQTGGLVRYDGKHFESVPISHSRVSCLFEDREGNLWVGTPEGLNEVRRRGIVAEGSPATPPSQAVGSLCEDTDGTLWAATKDGCLVRRLGSEWQPFLADGNTPVTGVTRLAAAPDGGLWIGTRKAKLLRWHNGKLTAWNSANGLTSESIAALFATRRGDVWAAGRQPVKLIHISGGKLENLDPTPRIGFLRAITEERDGTIWMGGDESTLLRYHEDTLTNALALVGSSRLSIRCLWVAPDGGLWIAFADHGIGRLKDGRLAAITTDQGLYNNDVRQIIADDRGWLWFGSSHGLFKVRLEQLNAVADSRAARVQSVRYGREDDLPELEASIDDCASALRTRDGRVWIPMGMALAVIDPANLRDDLAPPPVYVKSLAVDHKVLAAYGGLIAPASGIVPVEGGASGLRLSPDHRQVEFNFSAPGFQVPANLNFRYQLEGFDRQWLESGGRRAVYSRLAAGEYRFRVQACSSAGVWNETGAVIGFVVTPFFWQTWWFRALTVLAFAAVVAALMRMISFRRLQSRLSELERQTAIERERSRIARDLHDDLGSSVAHILLLNELALRNRVAPGEISSHAQKIADTARHIAQSLDEAVWAINPRNDDSPHLIEYIGQYAIEFLKAAGVRCRLDFPEELPRCKVSADVRHHLLCATKEALNNAVRHGAPTEVRLQIEVSGGEFRLMIRDDGGGFQPRPGASGGDGLRNMRERLEKIGGQCEITSPPGGGTVVVFTLPWNRLPPAPTPT